MDEDPLDSPTPEEDWPKDGARLFGVSSWATDAPISNDPGERFYRLPMGYKRTGDMGWTGNGGRRRPPGYCLRGGLLLPASRGALEGVPITHECRDVTALSVCTISPLPRRLFWRNLPCKGESG